MVVIYEKVYDVFIVYEVIILFIIGYNEFLKMKEGFKSVIYIDKGY